MTMTAKTWAAARNLDVVQSMLIARGIETQCQQCGHPKDGKYCWCPNRANHKPRYRVRHPRLIHPTIEGTLLTDQWRRMIAQG